MIQYQSRFLRPFRVIKTSTVVLLLATTACTQTIIACPPATGVALQVLGSGGPIADDGRASSSYLIWIDGHARILIDAGGGSFLRFGEAGAKFSDLHFIGISHFHTDHSADLPALLKSGYFSDRHRDLAIAGPGSSDPFPGLGSFLDSLLNQNHGAYGYLGGYLDGSGNLSELVQSEIDATEPGTRSVYKKDDEDIRVDAMGVPHGIVPALSYRVSVADKTIVFSGDQNGDNDAFIDFAEDTDILVMHMAVPEGATGAAAALHATPGEIGIIASRSGARMLVLSHFMARSLNKLSDNIDAVKTEYGVRPVIASDLACYPLD